MGGLPWAEKGMEVGLEKGNEDPLVCSNSRVDTIIWLIDMDNN